MPLPPDDDPDRALLILLLLARAADLAPDQVVGPDARDAAARGLTAAAGATRAPRSAPLRTCLRRPGYQPSAVQASPAPAAGSAWSAARWRPCCSPRW